MATKEYAAQYRRRNLEKCKSYDRIWRLRHRDRLNKKLSEYRRQNRELIRQRENDRNRENRLKILWMLGSVCSKCGFSDWRALQIDHVKGNGNEERRARKFVHNHGSWMKILTSRKEDYQILCANCNWIKRHENNEFGKHAVLSLGD